MAYRKNPTDMDQTKVETAQFEDCVPVFEDAQTREIVRGGGGAEAVDGPHGVINRGTGSAGVIHSFKDYSGIILSDTIGRG